MGGKKIFFDKIFSCLCVLLVCTITFGFLPVASAEDTVENNEQKVTEYSQRIDELNNELSTAKQNEQAETDNIKLYEEKQTLLSNQIVSLQTNLAEIDKNIKAQQQKISESQAKIEEQEKQLHTRVRSLYMSGGQNSILDTLFGAKNFLDFFDRLTIVKEVTARDARLISDYKSEVDNLNTEAERLAKTQTEKSENIDAMANTVSELQNSIQQSSEYIENYKQQESQAEEAISANTAELEKLNSQIENYYAQLKKQQSDSTTSSATSSSSSYTPDSDSTPDYNPEPDPTPDYDPEPDPTPDYDPEPTPTPAPSSGSYYWPVPSSHYISSYYGEDRGYSHKGIDIATSQGNVIIAAASGTVNYAWYNSVDTGSTRDGGGYGIYCMIDHNFSGDSTYSTLYAHMCQICVSPGQEVQAGEVIGYIGSTGESTGPHLHFETRRDGVCYNPLSEF